LAARLAAGELTGDIWASCFGRPTFARSSGSRATSPNRAGSPFRWTVAPIADGLMPKGSWSPGMMNVYRPMIERGFARRKDPPRIEDFPIDGPVGS
jgi:hypothetical protein